MDKGETRTVRIEQYIDGAITPIRGKEMARMLLSKQRILDGPDGVNALTNRWGLVATGWRAFGEIVKLIGATAVPKWNRFRLHEAASADEEDRWIMRSTDHDGLRAHPRFHVHIFTATAPWHCLP
jgi:hypothetical protein